MTYEEALKLLRSFEIKPGDDWDRHCICVGDIAWKLALEISKYTYIDPDEVRIMGLVHDFGRSVTNDPYKHAYEGYKLMKNLGYEKYARICACHSNGTFKPEDIEEYGLAPEDFYVRTLPEKLVFISDNLECHGKIVRNDIRIKETIERYKEKDPSFIPILESKLSEFIEFDNEIKKITGSGVYEILKI